MINGVIRRAGAAFAAITSGVLVIGAAVPVQAASTPGWRQVLSKHYGPANDYPAYGVVLATGRNSAWALGGTDLSGGNGTVQRPVALRWNGRKWSGYPLPSRLTSNIIAASAPAANDIWAVTQFGGYILHWNGNAWSLAKQLPWNGKGLAPQLTGVVALSTKNVWVFGSSGFTLGWGTWHYNGRLWRQWHGNAADITNGSALSATNIWTVGGLSAPQSQIVRYTGTWKPVASPVLAGLQFEGIHAFAVKNVWASAVSTGGSAASWLVHYNGRSWSKVRLPYSMTLNWGPIVSDGHGGLWLAGLVVSATTERFYVVHRTAKGAWSRTQVGAQMLSLANIPGTASVWGAGAFYGRVSHLAVIYAYGRI